MSSHSAIIAGTGSYVPEKRLTNADLAKMVDTSDEWIVQRTGIRERRITDYTDRSSCILFGDGAGAVVLQRGSEARRGVLYSSLHADGNGWELIYCQPGSRHPIDATMVAGRQQFMKIKGREVYKFAVQRFYELIDDAMRKCELSIDQIKLIVPHQVNQRIIDSALERLNISPDKAFVNIEKYGNTSSASSRIALDE